MNAKYTQLCCLFLFLFALPAVAQSDFFIIRSRVREQALSAISNKNLQTTVQHYLKTQQPDGSWNDIPYADESVTKWPPSTHLERVQTMAVAFNKKNNCYYHDTALKDAIATALRFWYNANPKSSNWWHNEIATPQALGEILILMQDVPNPLSSTLQDSMLQRMERGNPFDKTGANKLDIAIHYLYRACLTNDPQLLDTAVQQAFEPVMFTTGEGLQHDYAYMQHGAQLQVSSYGLVFLTGTYKVAALVAGTNYALSGTKLNMLGNYLVHTFLSAIRGRYIDFNTEGRGISRPNILDKAKLAKKGGLLDVAASLQPAYRQAIVQAQQRIAETCPPYYGVAPLHNYFWAGDYTQHVRPGYLFTVRTVSNRTKRTETGNMENLLGTSLADGATNIQVQGAAYFNIMPVWEWDKIPGTTSRDFQKDPAMQTQWGEAGSTAFVGGVSDSLYGATVYQMNYNGVKAKKSWFFFDKEVICMGAGISSLEAENIVTTLNQCWLKGPVKLLKNNRLYDLEQQYYAGVLQGVWHDSIGYFFPQHQNIVLSQQTQTGRWSDINEKSSDKKVSGPVFKLWMDHGAAPKNAGYCYLVLPGISTKKPMVDPWQQQVKIIQNDSNIQAVEHTGLHIMQGIFYHAGNALFSKYKVAVSSPCAVMLKEVGDEILLSISDPSQTQQSIDLTVTDAAAQLQKAVHCVLPRGTKKGATAFFRISKKP